MSFTNIFGGFTVSPSYVNYASYALTSGNSPFQFVWPLQFTNSTNVVAQIIDITANANSLSFVMPDATNVSVGQSVLFNNVGAHTITIYEHDGVTVLASLVAASSTYIYLIDNSSSNGSWRQVPWGGGNPAVVNVAAVSTSPDLIITGSPITNSGTFTFSFSGTIDNIINVSGNGLLVKTGSNTWATRTITGTANQITATNGDGVAGNPTLALASNVSGINSITAGHIQIGVGGTNLISTSDGLALQTQQNLALLAAGGSPAQLQWWNGANTHYVGFQASNSVSANKIWTLPLTDGTLNQVLTTDGSGNLSWSNAGAGTVNSVSGTLNRITSTGGTNPVIDISASYVGQSSITTLGTIGTGVWQATPVVVSFGGTGNTTFTAYGVICGGTLSTGMLQSISPGTAGQALISNGNAALPSFQNVTTTTWVAQATSVAMVGNTSYLNTASGGLATYTIPATVAQGTEFAIVGTATGTSGWKLQANTGQTIYFGNQASTVAGSWSSSNQYDSINIVCHTANTTFYVTYAVGNITPA